MFLLFFIAATFSESFSEPWGVDADLAKKAIVVEREEKITTKPIAACTAMIVFFQKRISPIDGPRSHYSPTSSQYALLAIQKYGVFKGIALGCDRLMRENQADWIYPIKNDRKVDPVR